MGRNLVEVLDKILAEAPDLEPHLRDLHTSAAYAAPEMMAYWWNQVALVLNREAMTHPKRQKLIQIFS